MKLMLDVQELHVSIQGRKEKIPTVRGVAFQLWEGERLGIVGESGAGKTILMKALLKLLPPTGCIESGVVNYRGVDLMQLSEHELRKIRGKEIGMIFQDPMAALNPTMTIGAQITEGYSHHFPHVSKEEARARGIELLRQVGVPEPAVRFDQYPHLLSGGLRQRTLIALVLAPMPRLIIADEPTTALDATIQTQILELLRKLQYGKSTILVTHDLSLVASFCDRVVVMYAGQIVEEGTTDKLFTHPQHPYTQKLLQAIPHLHHTGPLTPIPGSPPNLARLQTGCSFCNRCADAMPICQQEEPPLFGQARCWLYDPRRKKC